MTRDVNQVFFGNDVISLQSSPLDFRVFIHVYSLRPQTYFRSYLNTRTKSIHDIKVRYPQEYSTVPWVPEVFLACGGNFRCWPKADTSSAVGRSREKNLWHGAVLFTVPVDL